LTVVLAGVNDYALATLPYAVEVVPVATAFPPSLLVGDEPAKQWRRRVVIESRRDLVGEPTLAWSDETIGKVVQAKVTREGSRVLRVELSGVGQDGPKEAVLTVRVDGTAVRVPIQFARTHP
jgi:hypothetical protein